MSHLERALGSTSVAENLAVYESWAEEFNNDVLGSGYVAPKQATEHLIRQLGSRNLAELKILDAGCGTGLVGQALAERGATQIHGIDLSPAMLKVAQRTGVYQTLDVADLSVPLQLLSDSYDATVCVGTLTEGHVGPVALDELVRVTKPGGVVVATVRESIWEKNGYKSKIDSLTQEGKVDLVKESMELQAAAGNVRAQLVIVDLIVR